MNEEIPDYAMIPAAEKPARLIPATDDLRSSRLRLTELHRLNVPEMNIEEDLLVPDIRPDLEKIVNIDAEPEISGYEAYKSSSGADMIKISGNFDISTLYIPSGSGYELVSITSKIPFRYEVEISEPIGNNAEIEVEMTHLTSKVINERKIRVSAGASFQVKEYGESEIEFLEGVRDESLLLKKEKIRFTDMAQRRTDTIDIHEKIRMKDSQLRPSRILKYDVNVVETHRQIAKGKAVIEANAYYSILYVPETEDKDAGGDMQGRNAGDSGQTGEMPVFFRGKTEFTQFIRLPDTSAEDAAGSIVSFEVMSSKLVFKDGSSASAEEENDENDETAGDNAPYLQLDLTIATGIQLYRDIEREIVTDMYHRSRELEFSTTSHKISELCGTGLADISLRDTINIDESKGTIDSVPYISVKPEKVTQTAESDRCTIEGTLNAGVLFTDEQTGEIVCSNEKIPFRTVIDIPGVHSDTSIECVIGLKDIWFDKMNGRQVDFNCGISIRVYAWNVTPYELIDKVCYVEYDEPAEEHASMVVYIANRGDTQWSIAKRFRTTIEALQNINALEEDEDIEEGRRLLIV